jgi:hypothetical protein
MNRLAALAVALGAFFPTAMFGQDTNTVAIVAPTKLDGFSTNVGTVIIRATTDVGSVAANTATLTVKCEEMTEPRAGRREYGLGIEIVSGRGFKDTRLIDYDELDSFLNGVDYLGKVDWSVTTLNSFHASYTTKSGFRVDAFSSKRSGYIEYSVHDLAAAVAGIPLTRDQIVQLVSFLEQAKGKLDAVRGK